jgi:hypothetical protein
VKAGDFEQILILSNPALLQIPLFSAIPDGKAESTFPGIAFAFSFPQFRTEKRNPLFLELLQPALTVSGAWRRRSP